MLTLLLFFSVKRNLRNNPEGQIVTDQVRCSIIKEGYPLKGGMTVESKRKKKTPIIAGAAIAAVALIAVIAIVGINSVSIDKIPEYISDGDYNKVVKAYNKYAPGNDAEKKDADKQIDNLIDSVFMSWADDEMSAEDAEGMLETISGIDDKVLSEKASENRQYIVVETESNELYDQAETYFKNAEYLDALKSLVKIDKAYSKYEFVEDFQGDCEEILIAQVLYPANIEEYEDNQAKLEEYIEVVDAPAFVQKKEQMAREHDAFAKAAPILKKANDSFEKGEYKKAFDVLESAQSKDSDNRFISDALDDLHDCFIVEQAQKISAQVRKEDYDKALELADAAIEIYDCDELDSAREYVIELKHPSIRIKNNIVNAFTNKFGKWKQKEVDINQIGAEAGTYTMNSIKKLTLGDYDEGDVTLLSASGDIAASLTNVDIAFDLRDLSYDVVHWNEGEYFAVRVATDVVALLPVVGVVKCLKYLKGTDKGVKTGIKSAKAIIGTKSVAAKETIRLFDRSTDVGRTAEESSVIAKVLFRRYERYVTKCDKYAGQIHPAGIPIELKKVKYSDGRRIEGAFPVFKSRQNLNLPKALIKENEKRQFKWCDARLQTLAQKGKLKGKFTEEEIEIIKSGKRPKGYTWHHNEKEGLMQLVDTETHNAVKHTGGMALWGKGYGKKIPDDVSK